MTEPSKPPRIPWNPLAWTGTPVDMGEFWTLRKGKQTARCRLVTHALGGEMLCEIQGEFYESTASRSLEELMAAAETWKAEFQQKGFV